MFEQELDYKYLEEQGIKADTISVCGKIRKLAKLDRIRIDETEHRSGLNKHLFDYIDYCGKDRLQFIKEYLSNIQPYMIERRKDQEKQKYHICFIDNLYRVSVYIKVDTKQFEELIVSFHEDNKRGIAKSKYVAVYADCILSRIHGENKWDISSRLRSKAFWTVWNFQNVGNAKYFYKIYSIYRQHIFSRGREPVMGFTPFLVNGPGHPGLIRTGGKKYRHKKVLDLDRFMV